MIGSSVTDSNEMLNKLIPKDSANCNAFLHDARNEASFLLRCLASTSLSALPSYFVKYRLSIKICIPEFAAGLFFKSSFPLLTVALRSLISFSLSSILYLQ